MVAGSRYALLVLVGLAGPVFSATLPDHAGFVAYLRGGDVWTKHLPDGRERQLTTDGRNSSPHWSPTGRWLSYRKGSQLWITRRSGEDSRVLNGGRAVGNCAWSPKEDTLVYTIASGGVAISFVNEGQDGYLAAPAHPANSSNHGLVWSPDGQWVAYALEQGPQNQVTRSAELWQVRSDGHSALLVTTEGADAPGLVAASWSGDSKRVLFWQVPGGSSASLQADGVDLHAITAGGGQARDLGVKTLLYYDWIAAAPHGDHVAAVDGAGRESWTNKRLVVLDLTRGRLILLTDPQTAVASPRWSPDGERIAYAAAPDAGKVNGEKAKAALFRRRIWVTSRTGYTKQQLTRDPLYRDEYPLWDPDGSDILFVRLDKAGHASLWMMHADGTEARKMVDSLTPGPDALGNYGHIDWSDLFDWRRSSVPAPSDRPKQPPRLPVPPPSPLRKSGGTISPPKS